MKKTINKTMKLPADVVSKTILLKTVTVPAHLTRSQNHNTPVIPETNPTLASPHVQTGEKGHAANAEIAKEVSLPSIGV